MKNRFFILLLFVLFSSCYTQLQQGALPGSYADIMGTDYFIPAEEDYPDYKSFSKIFGHWVSKAEYSSVIGNYFFDDKKYDVFFKIDIDSIPRGTVKFEYIFYPDGSLEWRYCLEKGRCWMEQGIWGICRDDLTKIKIKGTTRYMRNVYFIEKITDSVLFLNDYNNKAIPEVPEIQVAPPNPFDSLARKKMIW